MIITVNLVMARFAITSWSGLVVPNTYVASQQFNAKAAESRDIAALGYQLEFGSGVDGLSILFSDRRGEPALADSMVVALRRPVGTDQDRELVMERGSDGIYRAEGQLAEGEWIATVTASNNGQMLYKRGRRFHVKADGSLRP